MPDRFVAGDSNVLVHLTNTLSADHMLASLAIERLEDDGAVLVFTSQNLAEFWNVCTRQGPGGLGLSIEETASRVSTIEAHFFFLPETSDADRIFKDLLVRYRVKGVQVHDARLAAVLISNGVRDLLTFDLDDFRRFSEIAVLHPKDIT